MKPGNRKFNNCIALVLIILFAAAVSPPTVWAGGVTPSAMGTSPGGIEAGTVITEKRINVSDAVDWTETFTNGQTVVSGLVSEDQLLSTLNSNPGAESILLESDRAGDTTGVEFTGSTFKTLAARGISVEVVTPSGTYLLPAGEISVTKLTGDLKTDTEDLRITLFTARAGDSEAARIESIAGQKGFSQLAAPTRFWVEGKANGKTVEVAGYSSYVSRTLKLDSTVDINTATGVVFRERGGLIPVPTQFTLENGQPVALIKHKDNGIYTVIDNPKKFGDLARHWARYDVNTLASKLVVSGISDNAFAPGGKVTRAQLAVMTVRALGLAEQSAGGAFRDVRPADWYAGAVGAAVKAGIIKGYSDGTFRPNAYVTREQVAAILIQALRQAGGPGIPGSADTEQLLSSFRDRKGISPWARQFVAAAVQNGIIKGDSTGAFAPQKISTRAEAAVMIRKMLGKAGLITPTFNIITPGDNFQTNKSMVKVTGLTEAGSSVTLNGRPAVVDALGGFAGEAPVMVGSNLVKVVVVDPAGHSAVLERTVICDTSAPGFRITAPEQNLITNKSEVTITGAAEPGSRVRVNGLPAEADADGNFSRVVNLNVGKNIVTVTATDPAGNEQALTRNITYDNEPPILAVTSPVDKAQTGSDLLIVTGYTEPGVAVKVNGRGVSTDSGGNFSKVIDLKLNSNTVTITATDDAQNVTEVIRGVVFDDNRVTGLTLPPQIRVGYGVSLGYQLSLDAYVTIEVRKENGSLIKRLADNVFKPAGSHSISWNGKDTDGNVVSDGDYEFSVEARDSSGKVIGRVETMQTAATVPVMAEVTASAESFNPLAGERFLVDYDLSSAGLVTARVYRENELVRTLAVDQYQSSGENSISWDGRDDAGSFVGDGLYLIEFESVNRIDASFASKWRGRVTVESGPPGLTDLSLSPEPYVIDKYRTLSIKFTLNERAKVTLKIVAQNGTLVNTLLNGQMINPGSNSFTWNGRRSDGKEAAPGAYKVVISAVDNYGKQSGEVIKAFTVGKPAVTKASLQASEYGLASLAAMPYAAGAGESSIGLAAGDVLTEFTISPDPLRLKSAALSIKYSLSRDAYVTLKIVDSSGQLVRTLQNNIFRKGGQPLASGWDGRNAAGVHVPEGRYKVVLEIDGAVAAEDSFQAAYQPIPGDFNISPSPFNPDVDKEALFRYTISADALVTVEVVSGSTTVARLLEGSFQTAGEKQVKWDGKDSAGKVVGDGYYSFRVTTTSPTISQFSTYRVPRERIAVEKEKPSITEVSVAPEPFRSDKFSYSVVRFQLSENATVSVSVYNSGGKLIKPLYADQLRRAGFSSASWDGKNAAGNVVAEGTYKVVIRAVDEFGNIGQGTGSVMFYPSFGVASTTPDRDATGVSLDSTIVVTLNDTTKAGEKFDDIKLQVEGRDLQYRAQVTGSTLKITPSAKLAYGTKYSVSIPAGSLTDVRGKELPTAYSFSFTTETASRENSSVDVNLAATLTSSPSTLNNRTVNTVTSDEVQALKILEDYTGAKTVIFPVTVDSDIVSLELTNELVKEVVYRKSVIKFQTPKAALLVPASEFDLEELAGRLGVDEDDVRIIMTISLLEQQTVSAYQGQAQARKLKMVAGPVSFRVEAAAGDSRIGLDRLKRHIGFAIYLPAGTSSYVGGFTLTPGSKLLPVPTQYITDSGRNAAVIRTKSGGTFAVIENKRVFRDMDKHWAQSDVQLLTARLIINGVNDTTYAPKRNVTRAEFATMLVKALGLEPTPDYSRFLDVKTGAWYTDYVTAAVRADIVSGYQDGTFRPNAYIKREEAAAMVSRALELADMNVAVADSEAVPYLDLFKDKARVSPWAKGYVAGAAKNGLIRGYKDGTFAPARNITRAESAALVRNMMYKAGLV